MKSVSVLRFKKLIPDIELIEDCLYNILKGISNALYQIRTVL